jgi:UMF1 family MFS transporter
MAHGVDDRRAVRAWCLYDWANSAFTTCIVSAILPPYFAQVASRSLEPHEGTATWGYTSSIAMLISAVCGALLGAATDRTGHRKRPLLLLISMGAAATMAIALLPKGEWHAILVLAIVAFVAWACANVLYDAMLPVVAPPGELHRVSTRGFAYGYVGGGVMLAVGLAWIMMPQRFGLTDANAAIRLTFIVVGVWWLLFSIPLFRRVPEPASVGGPIRLMPLAGQVVRQVVNTLRSARQRPDLFRFLIAFWLYSDGIGTIVKMGTIYGNEVGIGRNDLIGALLMVQLLAAPATVLFGRIAPRIGARQAVLIGLAGYVGLTMLAFFMSKPIHFWILGAMVAMFQGGTQALSRSLFISLVPPRQMGEMFGFYSLSEKLAGVVGPLLFGLAAQLSGSSRLGVFMLLPLFIGGGLLLMTVDFERGARQALVDGGAAGDREPRTW